MVAEPVERPSGVLSGRGEQAPDGSGQGADELGRELEPEPGDLNLPWQSESDREDTARS